MDEAEFKSHDWAKLPLLQWLQLKPQLTPEQLLVAEKLRKRPEPAPKVGLGAAFTWNTLPSPIPFASSVALDDFLKPEFWFVYFWGEAMGYCGTELGQHRRKELVDFCNRLFDAKQSTREAPVLQAAYGPTLSDFAARNAAECQALLTDLLKIGFVPIERVTDVKMGDSIRAQTITDIQSTSFKKLLEQTDRFDPAYSAQLRPHEDVQVAWRCESRPWSLVKEHGGTRRQVDVDDLSTKFGFDKDWHPYKDDAIRSKLWYRMGQRDNCLYTVTSVGLDMMTCSAFPRIDDQVIYKLPAKPLAEWTESERKTHVARIALVKTSDGKNRYMLATKVYAYMFLVGGITLFTNKAQEAMGKKPFPEWGVSTVPMDNIFGSVPIIRVHHGHGARDGFTGFLQLREVEYAAANVNEASFLDALEAKYKGATDELMRRFSTEVGPNAAPDGRFTSAWSETGRGTPLALKDGGKLAYTVERIVKFPVSESGVTGKAWNDLMV